MSRAWYIYRAGRCLYFLAVASVIAVVLWCLLPGQAFCLYFVIAVALGGIGMIAEKYYSVCMNVVWGGIGRIPGMMQFLSREHWNNIRDNDYKKMNPDRYLDCRNFLKKELLPRLQPQSTVADIGCGDGWFVREIAADCREVIGIDFSSSLLEVARHRSAYLKNATFRQADIISAALPEQYDCVSVLGIFCCIAEEGAFHTALDHALRSLKSGGLLLVRDAFAVDGRKFGMPEIGVVYRDVKQYMALFESRNLELLAQSEVGFHDEYQGRETVHIIFIFRKKI